MPDNTNSNATDGTVKDAFKNLWDGLKKVAGDLTTLEVVTVSGEMKMAVTNPSTDAKDKEKWNLKNSDAILNIIANPPANASGSLYLVAYTRIDFDHDTVNFVNANPTEEDKRLYTLHVESIKAAQEARAAFINMLAGVFKLT
ncbi:MAG: hypothetical protein U0176_20675 [Bacteroidia bacterium]